MAIAQASIPKIKTLEQRTSYEPHQRARTETLRAESITVVNISEAGVRRHLPAVGASSSSSINALPLSILPWSSGALLGLVGALASAKPHASVCSVPLGGYWARSNMRWSHFSQEM
jgi:hypothetical protein